MKLKFTIAPLGLVAGFAAYVVLHPGVAYAEPRMAAGMVTPFAQAGVYSIDTMHTSISFEINHLGLTNVHGRFNKFTGKIVEDEKDLAKSRVEITIDASTIDTAIAARDAHLRTAEFFDTAKYSTITFKSTKVEKTKTGYAVTGDLTIKGKTKSITIPFKHYGPYEMKGMGDQPARIGIIAEPITIKRSDFGVGSTAPLPDGRMGASDEVVIRLAVEGILDKK